MRTKETRESDAGTNGTAADADTAAAKARMEASVRAYRAAETLLKEAYDDFFAARDTHEVALAKAKRGSELPRALNAVTDAEEELTTAHTRHMTMGAVFSHTQHVVIYDMREAGMSFREIARTLGISRWAAWANTRYSLATNTNNGATLNGVIFKFFNPDAVEIMWVRLWNQAWAHVPSEQVKRSPWRVEFVNYRIQPSGEYVWDYRLALKFS